MPMDVFFSATRATSFCLLHHGARLRTGPANVQHSGHQSRPQVGLWLFDPPLLHGGESGWGLGSLPGRIWALKHRWRVGDMEASTSDVHAFQCGIGDHE